MIDREPGQRFIFVLKQALTYCAPDVALFILIEMIDHLDIVVSATDIFKAATTGGNIKCIKIVLKFMSYMMNDEESDELHLKLKRSTIKHQDLYHAEELNLIKSKEDK